MVLERAEIAADGYDLTFLLVAAQEGYTHYTMGSSDAWHEVGALPGHSQWVQWAYACRNPDGAIQVYWKAQERGAPPPQLEPPIVVDQPVRSRDFTSSVEFNQWEEENRVNFEPWRSLAEIVRSA